MAHSPLVEVLNSWRLAGLTAYRFEPSSQKIVAARIEENTDEENVAENLVSDSAISDSNMISLAIQNSSLGNLAAQRGGDMVEGEASRPARLGHLADEVSQCRLCAELAETRTQTVFGVGNPNARLVFLGEAPGADEDKQGVPFVGRAGQLLTDIITKGMQKTRDEFYICNILRCRPPENRKPLPEEANNCRAFLDRTLEIIAPQFICCLGSVAAQNLLGTTETIGRLRGRVHDYRGIRVVCTYHPAYLLRNPAAKKDTWEDIKLLMSEMDTRIG